MIWLAAVTAGALAIGPVFGAMSTSDHLPGSDSARAQEAAAAVSDRGTQVVAVVDGADAARLVPVTDELRALPDVKEVSKPLAATDGSGGVLISVTTAKLDSKAQASVAKQVRDRLRGLPGDVPGATVKLGGDSLNGDANKRVQQDLNQAELVSLPVVLLVLVFVFGGVVAAGLPVLAGAATIAGAFGVLFGFSRIFELNPDAITVVTLLGLGLSIDYGLLLVARYREELAAGHDPAAAVARTWTTAGRTILFSALTVAAALTGLLVFDIGRLRALGAAGISVALVAMLAALTLTAALLGLFRKRIKPGKAAALAEGTGFFAKLARGTQRRPLLVVLGCLVVLLAAGAPLLQMTLKVPQLEALPRTIESVRVADELVSRFGQPTQPAVRVHAHTDPATLDAWAAHWVTDPAVAKVEKAKPIGGDLSFLSITVPGDPQGAEARDLAARIAADKPAGVETFVSGNAAVMNDLTGRLVSGLPLAVAITLLAMFVLLFLMTGSVIIPLKAVLMNVVSLGATFGVLIAIFQEGHLSGLLDTLTVGGLSPYTIVIVFAFAFGLSLDYEVFLLSRIKEYHDAGRSTDDAVRSGLQASGRLISAAAVLMLIVFAAFGAAKMGAIEAIGIGLFVAVLVDATIVRCLLVPATMTLLGRFAWWAPRPLRRLHRRFGLHEATLPPAEEKPVPVSV